MEVLFIKQAASKQISSKLCDVNYNTNFIQNVYTKCDTKVCTKVYKSVYKNVRKVNQLYDKHIKVFKYQQINFYQSSSASKQNNTGTSYIVRIKNCDDSINFRHPLSAFAFSLMVLKQQKSK